MKNLIKIGVLVFGLSLVGCASFQKKMILVESSSTVPKKDFNQALKQQQEKADTALKALKSEIDAIEVLSVKDMEEMSKLQQLMNSNKTTMDFYISYIPASDALQEEILMDYYQQIEASALTITDLLKQQQKVPEKASIVPDEKSVQGLDIVAPDTANPDEIVPVG